MPTSDDSWSAKLRQITELELPDHYYLSQDDLCFYFGSYTPGAGWSHSSTNQKISNLKKPVSRRAMSEYRHKEQEILSLGRAIGQNIKLEALANLTFVPVPPSKTPDHPEYDDRMYQVARRIGNQPDIRFLVETRVSRAPRHTSGERRNPDELRATLCFNDTAAIGCKPTVCLIDDVLTTGCSFRVCKDIILENLPDVIVVGIFGARCVRETPQFDDQFDF